MHVTQFQTAPPHPYVSLIAIVYILNPPTTYNLLLLLILFPYPYFYSITYFIVQLDGFQWGLDIYPIFLKFQYIIDYSCQHVPFFLILFNLIHFYAILSSFTQSYPVLSNFIQFYQILSTFIHFNLTVSNLNLYYFSTFHPVLSNLIRFCILFEPIQSNFT